MGSGAKKRERLTAQIAQLELKKRSGFFRSITAIIIFAVLIMVKLYLQYVVGAEFVTTDAFSIMFFITAIVAAAFAGSGSRDWIRARNAIKAAENQLRKK